MRDVCDVTPHYFTLVSTLPWLRKASFKRRDRVMSDIWEGQFVPLLRSWDQRNEGSLKQCTIWFPCFVRCLSCLLQVEVRCGPLTVFEGVQKGG